MSRKPRVYLCQGCTFAPTVGVINGYILCGAAQERVVAMPHTKGRRYESCPHRQNKYPPGNKKQQLLRELARRCREADTTAPGSVERIEIELRKEWSFSD